MDYGRLDWAQLYPNLCSFAQCFRTDTVEETGVLRTTWRMQGMFRHDAMDVMIIYDQSVFSNILYSFKLQVGAKVKCPESLGVSDLRQNTCQIWRTWFRDFKMKSYIHKILYTFVWLQALNEQVSSSSTWGVCGQWFFFRNLKCWGSMCCSDGRSENSVDSLRCCWSWTWGGAR